VCQRQKAIIRLRDKILFSLDSGFQNVAIYKKTYKLKQPQAWSSSPDPGFPENEITLHSLQAVAKNT